MSHIKGPGNAGSHCAVDAVQRTPKQPHYNCAGVRRSHRHCHIPHCAGELREEDERLGAVFVCKPAPEHGRHDLQGMRGY